MIWKPAYRTLVARDVAIPPLEGETDLLVGGFDFGALRDMAIWRRLVEADAPESRCREVILLADPQAQDQTLLETIVPPSLLPNTRLMRDEGNAWRHLIQPSAKHECFAAIVRGDRATILMKGIPTEDAWDAFMEAMRA